MNIREALRTQGPSLALQRAAGDEIAALDARWKSLTDKVAAEPHDPECPTYVDLSEAKCNCGKAAFAAYMESA